ncbi:MAG: hypothetical protein SO019_06600 [Lachnospiraceae bacterium]|nr:hypothetical protein [Lachnospiraceae bacterium]
MSQSKMNQNSMTRLSRKSEKKDMNRMLKNDQIDARTADDIEARIEELAKSYTPEWHYSKDDPDIGVTIAKIFAGQMSDNINIYNQVIEKYHTEFVNMLDISLLPAKPASALVLFDLVNDTVPGVEIPRGTQLIAQPDDADEPIIYETSNSIYVSNAVFTTAFMTKGKEGYVMPLLGKYNVPELIPSKTVEEESVGDTLSYEELMNEPMKIQPFHLFGKAPNISKNALLFYHTSAFDTADNPLYLHMVGDEKLLAKIRSGAYRFSYYGDGDLQPFGEVTLLGDKETFRLVRRAFAPEADTIDMNGKSYQLIVLEATEPVLENYALERVEFSSEGREQEPQSVNNGSTDLDVNNFDLFSDTLAIYQECYIGHDNYFAKAGSVITINFDVTYPEHLIELTKRQEEEELKIIKRKPKVIFSDMPADTYAEEIAIEYFNGIGWKKLECRQEYKQMFAQDKKGRYELTFVCPSDWAATANGAYEGRALRIQLLKSDNCYMRPCIHHYPHIRNMKISYCYKEHFVEPEKLVAVNTTRKIDCTRLVKAHRKFVAFGVGLYSEDAVYLGFRNRMESGPVSLYFDIAEGNYYDGLRCKFEYSTRGGFRQMKVVDNTSNFMRTGTVIFMPQSDMAPLVIENKQMYWIRITRSRTKRDDEPEKMLPLINDIRLNAVQVENIETKDEQDFYLDEVLPNMYFSLGSDHILDIDLWVNERDRHSAKEMKEMIRTMSDQVRPEYDMQGEISNFYVKWEEVERLDDGEHKRGYVLDRMNNRLLFGDGLHMDVPRVTDDVAFKVRVRCCDGQLGNVGKGEINEAHTNFMFLNTVSNPFKAYGGSDMEKMESALARGANILRSRKRLVSISDYEREILAYSDTIAQVRCITGKRIDGAIDPDAVTFVLLLKDYRAGSYTFHNLADSLKKYLMESCELTISPDNIHIVEPIFVDVCVDVWAQSMQMEDSFEIQNELQECLMRYLDPVESENGTGWKIGVMPKKNQLLMKLNVLKSKAIVRKLLLIAHYTDEHGTHETELAEIQENPFMVCRSGVHHVHLTVEEQ